MKKILCGLLITAMLLSINTYATDYPSISAKGAVVMDTQSGRVLFEKNSKTKMGMASTTKIMTALVAIEKGNLSDVVTVSKNAAYIEGSSMWLAEGERVTLENLIYGLMLVSGNDAATAIAEHVGGSEEKFISMMNEKAKEVGAVDTHFTNPHGLANDNHYTTAYDLGLITAYALKIPKFAEVVSTKSKTVPWEGHQYNRSLKNHNKLLNMYQGCDGVKTGFTKNTGRCLVSSATRDNWQIVGVTLNAPSDWSDHKNMLDYVFGAYKSELIAERGTEYGEISVTGGTEKNVKLVAQEDFCIPLAAGERDKVKATPHLPAKIAAPVTEGQQIGYVGIEIGGIEYISYPLMAEKEVLRRFLAIGNQGKNFTWVLKQTFDAWINLGRG